MWKPPAENPTEDPTEDQSQSATTQAQSPISPSIQAPSQPVKVAGDQVLDDSVPIGLHV